MTATFVADLNAGGLCPPVLVGLGPAGAQLEANLSAALALQVQASIGAPPLAVQLANLEAVAAVIAEGVALGLPGITFSISAAASLVASAQAALGALAGLTAMLGGPAMYVYSYSSTVGTIGSDLSTAISGTPPPGLVPSSACAGILVGAGVTAWATIKPFFGGL